MWQRQTKENHHAAQYGNGRGMAKSVKQAEPHGPFWVHLHTCNIGDGSDVVVIKPMAETHKGRGKQGELQASADATHSQKSLCGTRKIMAQLGQSLNPCKAMILLLLLIWT